MLSQCWMFFSIACFVPEIGTHPDTSTIQRCYTFSPGSSGGPQLKMNQLPQNETKFLQWSKARTVAYVMWLDRPTRPASSAEWKSGSVIWLTARGRRMRSELGRSALPFPSIGPFHHVPIFSECIPHHSPAYPTNQSRQPTQPRPT